MSASVDEPGPDAAEDLQRLAEEERRLAVVVEHEVRQQPGLRQHVPEDEDDDQQRRPARRAGRMLVRSPSSGRCSCCAVALQHLVAQHGPDRLVQLDEARRRAHLGDVARARAGRSRTRRSGASAGPADSTTTRSLIAIASSRSWVMKSTAFFFAAHSSSTSFSISWRVWMSSAENGSSIRMMSGSSDQRLRQADALAHAARELVRIAVAEAAEADALAATPRACAAASAHAAELEPGHHVLQRGAPGHQALGLEHVAGAPVDARRAAAPNTSTAPAARREQPGGDVQQRALAAAGRADDRDELARADRQRRRRAPRCSAGPGRPCRRRCR